MSNLNDNDLILKTSEDIIKKLYAKERLTNEVKGFIVQICESLETNPEIKDNREITEKIYLISEMIKKLSESFSTKFSDEISSKFYEYREIIMLQQKEKIILLNTISSLKNNLNQKKDFLKTRLESFQKASSQLSGEEKEIKNDEFFSRLNTMQNKTDYIIENLDEINSNKFETNKYLTNLEGKIDFIYKNLNSEFINSDDTDNNILITFRFTLQMYKTCQKLIESLDDNHPDKLILKQNVDDLDSFIYKKLKSCISQLYKDLNVFYRKIKKRLNN